MNAASAADAVQKGSGLGAVFRSGTADDDLVAHFLPHGGVNAVFVDLVVLVDFGEIVVLVGFVFFYGFFSR